MKIKTFAFCAFAALLAVSCYKSRLESIESRLDLLETVSIEDVKAKIADICSSLESVGSLVEAAEGYSAALETAVSSTAAGYDALSAEISRMKSACGGILDDVSGIETSLSKNSEDLEALSGQYRELKSSFDKLKTRVAAVKSSLTAIEQRMAAFGDFAASMPSTVSSREEQLEGALDDFEKDLGNARNHYSDLLDLLGLIDTESEIVRSVTIVPTESDGSVLFPEEKFIIRFDIQPLSVAESLVDSGTNAFGLWYVLTKGTKSGWGDIYQLTLLDVSFDGRFVCALVDGSEMDDLFKDEIFTANANLCVYDFNDIEFSSAYVPLKHQTCRYVDLGLSVKWASCNIGASSPEKIGGYFQWAGIEDVTDRSNYLDVSNCPYHTGSNENIGWSKYTLTGFTVLRPVDDIAHVSLGANWRMPTQAEFAELTEECNWDWTSDYNGTGMKGYVVSGKKTGFSDRKIFLPAAGFRQADLFFATGDYGTYWSSTLNPVNQSMACSLSFDASRPSSGARIQRYIGMPVRPVYADESTSL